MYTKIISILLALWITTSFLTSCSQDQTTGQISPDQSVEQSSPNESGPWFNRPMNSSGSYRWWRWSRSGSGSMMQKLSPEDQAILQQIRTARQNGDTTLADKLTEQLKQKNPNLHFGSGARRSGSGTNN